MAALTVLVPDVRIEIPGIPSFVAERQLLRAARLFTEETRAWRVNVQMSTVADTATVVLTTLLPTGTELVDIVSMKNIEGGEPVHPKTFKWLDQNTSDWRSNPDITAKWYVLDGNNTVRLVPTPSATASNQYDVRVAVKPLLTATAISDVVVNKFSENLVHGALALLYQIPNKPWSDAKLAGYHHGMFLDAMPAARVEAAEEFQTGIARKVKYGGL